MSHMLYANDPGEMQTMLNKLRTYAEKKGLTVNTAKSEVVHYNRKSVSPMKIPFTYDGVVLPEKGRGKGDSGQATFVGYHGKHRSRPDHILMTPNFYHNLLSTDIQPSNERIADHCSITACFKVRQNGLTGADMILEP